jgi:hypothetical protein
MAAHQSKFTAGDIYAGRRNGNMKLGQLGALKTASREVLRAQLTGTEPDKKRIGAPGDVLIGGEQIARYLNELCASRP